MANNVHHNIFSCSNIKYVDIAKGNKRDQKEVKKEM
jgi:hypothetical protein